MNNHSHITQPRLSSLIRDPFVRSAFERAERDLGSAMATVEPHPSLLGGAAKAIRAVAVRSLEIVGARP